MPYAKRGDAAWGADLYLITLRHADVCKVGRAWNPQQRFKQLARSVPFLEPELAAIFPDKGYLEGTVHRMLSARRVGPEWFKVSQAEAVELVTRLVQEAMPV